MGTLKQWNKGHNVIFLAITRNFQSKRKENGRSLARAANTEINEPQEPLGTKVWHRILHWLTTAHFGACIEECCVLFSDAILLQDIPQYGVDISRQIRLHRMRSQVQFTLLVLKDLANAAF